MLLARIQNHTPFCTFVLLYHFAAPSFDHWMLGNHITMLTTLTLVFKMLTTYVQTTAMQISKMDNHNTAHSIVYRRPQEEAPIDGMTILTKTRQTTTMQKTIIQRYRTFPGVLLVNHSRLDKAPASVPEWLISSCL